VCLELVLCRPRVLLVEVAVGALEDDLAVRRDHLHSITAELVLHHGVGAEHLLPEECIIRLGQHRKIHNPTRAE
jgi:hypothetical protein